MPAIEARQLTKTFGRINAVNNLDLIIHEGEIFGLVGPDGAGKTTTFRMLSALLRPTSGEAWVGGYLVANEAEAVKEHIGYMSQRFGLYPDLTVLENIRFYADIYGVPGKTRRERMDQLLQFSNLSSFQNRLAGRLSGGMKQKLALSCALIHTPRILLLDEPTNGVDPVSRRDFWQLLYQLLKERVTIVMSTCYMDEAERCNRIGLLHQGRLIACGTPAEIKQRMKGQVCEIYCAEPRNAMAWMRSRMPELRSALFGDRIHLWSPEPDQARSAVDILERESGIGGVRMRLIEPSLEDVFIAMIQSDTA